MRTDLCTSFLPTCVLFAVTLIGCSKSDSTPTQPGGTWTISGKTYLAGSTDPVAGVTVKCAGISATSGADGSYQLRGVPEGSQTVTVEMANYESYTRSIEVKSAVTLYIYLRVYTADLSGYVTNAIDGPVKGARVVLGALVDFTDISGHYEFRKAPRGTDTLSVSHASYVGFKTTISLTAPDSAFDVILKRDSLFQIDLYAYSYIDQSYPSVAFGRSPTDQLLYLRANGYDSLGVYQDKIERNILATLLFPQFLWDNRVSLVEARVQVCIAGPCTAFPIETFAVGSAWNSLVTYNTQPLLGPLLFSDSIGDASSAKYWTVLGTEGMKMLLADYRASGVNYGIEIKGGTVYPIAIFSSRATQNRPRVTLRVQF